jgi:cytoskeletal protein CcmA (bactofilin family)
MFGRRDRSNGRIDTLIGRNAAIQGDIEFAGGLHVDGRVAGSVRAAADGALSVSEFGVIEGSVAASQVVVNGRVSGDIFASDRVVLGSKAKVWGNVHYGVFEIALGAEINGKLVPLGHAPTGGRPQDASAEEGALPMAEGL